MGMALLPGNYENMQALLDVCIWMTTSTLYVPVGFLSTSDATLIYPHYLSSE